MHTLVCLLRGLHRYRFCVGATENAAAYEHRRLHGFLHSVDLCIRLRCQASLRGGTFTAEAERVARKGGGGWGGWCGWE